MYMRIVQMKIKPETLAGFTKLYEERIIPALQGMPGCCSAHLVHNENEDGEYLSLTLWDSPESAENYEKSGEFAKLIAECRPYLSESSEWKVQLSKDLKLEYKPVEEEPVVQAFPVIAQANPDAPSQQAGQMYMRVVRLKLHPDKVEEFNKLYDAEIIPALREITGCLYAYLTENKQEPTEAFSVTVWNRKENADAYEKSGRFDQLTDKVKHTFSSLYQWKMKLDQESGKKMATSDDMDFDYYEFVTGKKF